MRDTAVPSASIKRRIAALEKSQTLASDDVYWQWIMEHIDEHVAMFGKAISHEISLEEWHQWCAENPWPDRGRPLTPEEEREAESAREEFWVKIEQTRERLLNAGIDINNLNQPPMKESRHSSRQYSTRHSRDPSPRL
jgi:hypothetical protein